MVGELRAYYLISGTIVKGGSAGASPYQLVRYPRGVQPRLLIACANRSHGRQDNRYKFLALFPPSLFYRRN
jgi:hypothetical protein